MTEPPETDDPDDPFAPEHDYVPEDFDPDEATQEVWSGAEPDMRDMLISCLRENGIGCVVEDSAGTHRLRVMPESESAPKKLSARLWRLPRHRNSYHRDLKRPGSFSAVYLPVT